MLLRLLTLVLLSVSCAAPPVQDSKDQTGNQDKNKVRTWDDNKIAVEQTDVTFEATLGTRDLKDQEAWGPLASQSEFGLGLQVPFLGVRSEARQDLADYFDWDLGLRFAHEDARVVPAGSSETLNVRSRTWDLSGGLLFLPVSPSAMFQPYIGGGLALVFTDVYAVVGDTVQRRNDSFAAGYARGGLRIQVRSGQYFGVDVRWLSGGADVESPDAESTTISFLFGAQF